MFLLGGKSITFPGIRNPKNIKNIFFFKLNYKDKDAILEFKLKNQELLALLKEKENLAKVCIKQTTTLNMIMLYFTIW